MRLSLAAALLTLTAAPATAAPRVAIEDPDTRAWWAITAHLSSDAMEGRDIGSPGHDRAGRWVAGQFRAAGLKPAGDKGTFFQSFPVHESRVEAATVAVDRSGGSISLRFLQEFSVRAADDLPAAVEGSLTFAGYCRPDDLIAARGKVAICFNTRRTGLTTGAERIRNAQAAGAAAIVQVDDPGFTIEPYRWPAAYARSITLADSPAPATGGVRGHGPQRGRLRPPGRRLGP